MRWCLCGGCAGRPGSVATARHHHLRCRCMRSAVGTSSNNTSRVANFHGKGKQGSAIAGNCHSTGNCRRSAPSDSRSGWEFWMRVREGFMPPARVGCMWHPKHIKNSSRAVRLKFQTEWRAFCLPGAKTPWQQPRALWAAQKPGSEIPGISISTFQRGNGKQGSEIAG